MGCGTAVYLHTLKPRLRSLLTTAILVPMLMPPVMGGVDPCSLCFNLITGLFPTACGPCLGSRGQFLRTRGSPCSRSGS